MPPPGLVAFLGVLMRGAGDGTQGLLIQAGTLPLSICGRKALGPLLSYQCFSLCCLPVCSSDKRIACEEEFSDSDEEGEGGRKNSSNFKKAKRVKTEDEKEKDPEEKKGEFGLDQEGADPDPASSFGA